MNGPRQQLKSDIVCKLPTFEITASRLSYSAPLLVPDTLHYPPWEGKVPGNKIRSSFFPRSFYFYSLQFEQNPHNPNLTASYSIHRISPDFCFISLRHSPTQPRLSLSLEKGLEQKAETAAIASNWLAALFWPGLPCYSMPCINKRKSNAPVM